MNIFKKREDLLEEDSPVKKIKDLKPENIKKRKEPPKPWSKKERLLVLGILMGTTLTAAFLAISARNFKLPNLPEISLKKINLSNLFKSETITIGGAGVDTEREKLVAKGETIKNKFAEIVNPYSGVYAFYFIDLNSGYSFGIHEKDIMQAASLIKLPVMASLYREYERGNLDLEDIYKLKSEDKRGGSGSLAGKANETELTLRKLAYYMGHESDNTAYTALVRIIGEDTVSKLIKDLNLTKTSLKENLTSPEDIGILFKKLWQKEIVSEKNRDQILEYLTGTIYEDWLPKKLPEGVKVAHKYGREIHVVNDAGIVFAQEPYVLVIMTKGIIEKEADEIIPDLSKMIYSEYAEVF